MSQRQDIHEQITNRIIEAIEKGAVEFTLPWHRPAGSIARPTNIQSKKGHRGINVVTSNARSAPTALPYLTAFVIIS
jgi:antirestriction protein ArdC